MNFSCFSMHQDKKQRSDRSEVVIFFNPKRLTEICTEQYGKDIYDQKYAKNQELGLDFLCQFPNVASFHIAKHKNAVGDTLLHVYSYLGKLEEVHYLHSIGCDVKAKNKKGETPIVHASFASHFEVMKYLFENKGYQPEDYMKVAIGFMSMPDEKAVDLFKQHSGKTRWCGLVHHAAQAGGNIGFLRHVLEEQKIKPKETNFFTKKIWQKRTPIHLAAENGHLEHLKLLIDNKYPIDEIDYEGYSPACYAAYNGHLVCLATLLSFDASLNGAKEGVETTLTLLHGAILNNQKEVIHFLLSNGANVNAGDYNGETPIFYAVVEGNLETVQLLLAHNADVTEFGFDLLQEALNNKHFHVAEFLLEQKISSVNEIEDEKLLGAPESILARMIKINEIQSVEFLLSKGADVHHPSVKINDNTVPEIVERIKNARKS